MLSEVVNYVDPIDLEEDIQLTLAMEKKTAYSSDSDNLN